MKIICFGDSNTFGHDPRGYFGGRYDHPWPELLADDLGCTVLNWGDIGREIPTGVRAFPEDTDLLIVMLGTNDLLQGASVETVCGRMEQFLRALNCQKVLLIAPPPMQSGTWVPRQSLIDDSKCLAILYRTLARYLGIRFADAGQWNITLAYDGVHMTEESHRTFADSLRKELTDQ